MITYILIALLFLSAFTLIAYFFSLNFINKKKKDKSIRIANTFIYEVTPQIKTERFFINILLFISLASTLGGTIVFASNYLDVMPIVIAVLSTILLFCLGTIPFINIKFLKEHLYLSLGAVVTFFAANGLNAFLSYNILKLFDYKDVTAIISLVISGILFLISFIFIMNPKLFYLKNDVNDEVIARPKTIHLAYTEWAILFSSPLILVPLILISSVLSI